MALRIEPVDGIYIKKSLGIDEEADVIKSFKIINDGTSVMFLRYPDLSTLRGVVIESSGDIGRTPDIEPDSSHTLVIRVKKDFINGFNTETIDKQFVDFKVEGYAPPPPPQPPTGPVLEYYYLFITPLDSSIEIVNNQIVLPIDQVRFKLTVRLIASYDDGSKKMVWPVGGFKFNGNTIVDDGQLILVNEQQDGTVWVVEFENRVGSYLNANWTAKVRDGSYIDQAGQVAYASINIVSEQTDVIIPPISDEEPPELPNVDEPISQPGRGGGPLDPDDIAIIPTE